MVASTCLDTCTEYTRTDSRTCHFLQPWWCMKPVSNTMNWIQSSTHWPETMHTYSTTVDCMLILHSSTTTVISLLKCYTAVDLVMVGLMYKAYSDCCWNKYYVLLLLRLYCVRGIGNCDATQQCPCNISHLSPTDSQNLAADNQSASRHIKLKCYPVLQLLKISKGVNVRCYLGVPTLTGSHAAGSAHCKRLYVQQIFLHQFKCAAVQDKGASEMAVGRPKLDRLQVWESVKQRQVNCFC